MPDARTTSGTPVYPCASTLASRRPRVAAWAGHSVGVLLRIYAKCIHGQDRVWERHVDDALGE